MWRSPVVGLLFIVGAILVISLIHGPGAAAVTLAPGDIVVVQEGFLSHVDPDTGQHTVIATAGPCCGNGRQFDLAIDANRQIVVITTALPNQLVAAVVRVNPVDGTQTIISQGGFLHAPNGVALDPRGDILVSDSTIEGVALVIRIHPLTGAQTLVSEGVGGWGLTVVPGTKKKR